MDRNQSPGRRRLATAIPQSSSGSGLAAVGSMHAGHVYSTPGVAVVRGTGREDVPISSLAQRSAGTAASPPPQGAAGGGIPPLRRSNTLPPESSHGIGGNATGGGGGVSATAFRQAAQSPNRRGSTATTAATGSGIIDLGRRESPATSSTILQSPAAPAPQPSHELIFYKGYVDKTAKYTKSWVSRHLRLEGRVVSYALTDDSKVKGSMTLTSVERFAESSTWNPSEPKDIYGMVLVGSQGERWVIRCSNDHVFLEWYRRFRTVLSQDGLCDPPDGNLPHYDPRMNLPFARVPLRDLSKFLLLDSAAIYSFLHVVYEIPLITKGPARGVIIIGDHALYLCDANGNIQRCLPFYAMVRVSHATRREGGCHIGITARRPEPDLVFRLEHLDHLKEFLRVLTTMYRFAILPYWEAEAEAELEASIDGEDDDPEGLGLRRNPPHPAVKGSTGSRYEPPLEAELPVKQTLEVSFEEFHTSTPPGRCQLTVIVPTSKLELAAALAAAQLEYSQSEATDAAGHHRRHDNPSPAVSGSGRVGRTRSGMSHRSLEAMNSDVDDIDDALAGGVAGSGTTTPRRAAGSLPPKPTGTRGNQRRGSDSGSTGAGARNSPGLLQAGGSGTRVLLTSSAELDTAQGLRRGFGGVPSGSLDDLTAANGGKGNRSPSASTPTSAVSPATASLAHLGNHVVTMEVTGESNGLNSQLPLEIDDMHNLLSRLGILEYERLLVDQGVDYDVLLVASPIDLLKFGIKNPKHRSALMREVVRTTHYRLLPALPPRTSPPPPPQRDTTSTAPASNEPIGGTIAAAKKDLHLDPLQSPLISATVAGGVGGEATSGAAPAVSSSPKTKRTANRFTTADRRSSVYVPVRTVSGNAATGVGAADQTTGTTPSPNPPNDSFILSPKGVANTSGSGTGAAAGGPTVSHQSIANSSFLEISPSSGPQDVSGSFNAQPLTLSFAAPIPGYGRDPSSNNTAAGSNGLLSLSFAGMSSLPPGLLPRETVDPRELSTVSVESL